MQPFYFIIIPMEYLPFDSFILRTPANSFSQEDVQRLNHKKIVQIFQNDSFFRQAVFTASQTLYNEAEKSLTQTVPERKIAESLAKYYMRYKTRCTPFGIFAGCTWGKIGKETKIILNSPYHYQKHIRLDMELVSKLTNYFSTIPEVQRQIKFYPNNSLFLLSDFYSYIEFSVINGKKSYFKTIADYDEYLASVLNFCEKGVFIEEIITFLMENGFEREDSEEYIISLIDNHILCNDLEISTTDTDPFKTLINRLGDLHLEEDHHITCFANKSKALMSSFSEKIKDDHYIRNIQDSKDIFGCVEHDANTLYQVDLQLSTSSNLLSERTVKKIGQSINIIHKFSPESEEKDPLKDFKNRFHRKYESEEIPLLEVLDEDFGLGYPYLEEKLVTPLIDTIKFPEKKGKNKIIWSSKDRLLSQKLSEFFLNSNKDHHQQSIEITDADIAFIADKDTLCLPDTLSALVEIYQQGNKEVVYIPGFSASAAKLLGRFSYFDEDIENITKSIIQKEAEYFDDVIFAEIIHLPEFREGNVLLRPQLTDYEIPILSRSAVSDEFQIPLKDLVLSVKNDELVLRSVRLNKRIIPRLSSAHFAGNAKNLSFYKFLADMQYQNIQKNIFFDWGVLGKDFKYLPRVQYKDMILSKAYWNITEKDTEYLTKIAQKAENLAENLNKWRAQNNIPAIVAIKDMDNRLYIDFDNELLRSVFLNEAKKRSRLMIEEVLFNDENLFIKDEEGRFFTNEFIVNFYKNGDPKKI